MTASHNRNLWFESRSNSGDVTLRTAAHGAILTSPELSPFGQHRSNQNSPSKYGQATRSLRSNFGLVPTCNDPKKSIQSFFGRRWFDRQSGLIPLPITPDGGTRFYVLGAVDQYRRRWVVSGGLDHPLPTTPRAHNIIFTGPRSNVPPT